MKKTLYILIISCFISCNNKLNHVLNISTIDEVPKIKLSLSVKIDTRLNSTELKSLAKKIYDNYDGDSYENVFIIYMLKGKEINKGSYASSHFLPELDLQLYQVTNDDIIAIKKHFPISKRHWIDGKMIIQIKNSNGKYSMSKFASDYSSSNSEILIRSVKKSDTIYKIQDAVDSAYYIVNSQNDLSIYDNEGYIDTYLKN